MNCPQCNGTRIEARHPGMEFLMDATEYRMRCGDCGAEWKALLGWRAPDPAWANVTFVEREES